MVKSAEDTAKRPSMTWDTTFRFWRPIGETLEAERETERAGARLPQQPWLFFTPGSVM